MFYCFPVVLCLWGLHPLMHGASPQVPADVPPQVVTANERSEHDRARQVPWRCLLDGRAVESVARALDLQEEQLAGVRAAHRAYLEALANMAESARTRNRTHLRDFELKLVPELDEQMSLDHFEPAERDRILDMRKQRAMGRYCLDTPEFYREMDRLREEVLQTCGSTEAMMRAEIAVELARAAGVEGAARDRVGARLLSVGVASAAPTERGSEVTAGPHFDFYGTLAGAVAEGGELSPLGEGVLALMATTPASPAARAVREALWQRDLEFAAVVADWMDKYPGQLRRLNTAGDADRKSRREQQETVPYRAILRANMGRAESVADVVASELSSESADAWRTRYRAVLFPETYRRRPIDDEIERLDSRLAREGPERAAFDQIVEQFHVLRAGYREKLCLLIADQILLTGGVPSKSPSINGAKTSLDQLETETSARLARLAD